MIETLRGIHIGAGFIALFAGAVAITLYKGGDVHRVAGKIFVFSGRIVVISAIVSAVSGVVAVDARLGGLAGEELVRVRDTLPVFFGVLGVLGFLSGLDLERGTAAITNGPRWHLRWIAIGSGISGLALTLWGIVRIVDGRGSASWFAVVIGVLGVETVVRELSGSAGNFEGVDGHASGMIDALFGFVAAFMLFGASRILRVSIFEDAVAVVVVVVITLVVGQWVKALWRRRLANGHPVAPVRSMAVNE